MVYSQNQVVTQWPFVDYNDWCGEFLFGSGAHMKSSSHIVVGRTPTLLYKSDGSTTLETTDFTISAELQCFYSIYMVPWGRTPSMQNAIVWKSTGGGNASWQGPDGLVVLPNNDLYIDAQNVDGSNVAVNCVATVSGDLG
jgi:hypothetical protein